MPDVDETTPLVTQSPPARPKMNSSSSTTATTYWRIGALYGAGAVIFGAFGAHGLKARAGITDAKLASWATAAHYQVSLLPTLRV